MKIEFRNFSDSYYEKMCDFLIELSEKDCTHINWNWARWEWMFFHPEFNRNLLNKVGLWFLDDNLVGIAVYDHYLGEAFFAAKDAFSELEREILDYAVKNLCDENGLGIAVNDIDKDTLDLLTEHGFTKNEQTENILELPLDAFDFSSRFIEGISFQSIDRVKDLHRHQEVLWKGFDHRGQIPMDEDTIMKQKRMLSAPHRSPMLHIAAQNERLEFVSYCGVWYDKNTDYAYVEPVCTVPQYRNMGIAKATLTEALKNAYALGARKAYVISDSDFYKHLGFRQHSHYTFYWYTRR